MEKKLYSTQGEILRTWLRSERLSKKLTMRTLAARLDVPHQFIAKVEHGERRLDVAEYVEYCRALGSDPHIGLHLITDPA